jgi:hypothetical protein
MLPSENVIHASTAKALTLPNKQSCNNLGDATAANTSDDWTPAAPSFLDVDFAAYYFDECGGFLPHVVEMMSAALLRPAEEGCCHHCHGGMAAHSGSWTTAMGYSLMRGNRDVVGKELDVCRDLTLIARTKGMRARHVLDSPARYGLLMDIIKMEGGTFTSWMLLEDAGLN